MYRKILVCLDNSDHSCMGIGLSIAIAQRLGCGLTGCHVYAARLHNDRFRQMESTLPERYQNEEELKRQRDIHDSLITRGLKIISDSYMAVLEAQAEPYGIEVNGVSREGKNYDEIVKEANSGGYDLVVLGALGLGRVRTSRIGSVCERVVRRTEVDTLVVRTGNHSGEKTIVVAIDGSPLSFGGLKSALVLSKVFDARVVAVSAFDPDFHYTAFRSIAGVLSEEAGRVFRFREQERLHEEIIDKGLAKIYRDHLDTAVQIADQEGIKIEGVLLSGKPYDKIIEYINDTSPFMLVMGKTGVHAVSGLDIGSNTENCLREVQCNVYISTRTYIPSVGLSMKETPVEWGNDALSLLERIPSFARGIVKNMVEDSARKEGLKVITKEFMWKVRKGMGGNHPSGDV